MAQIAASQETEIELVAAFIHMPVMLTGYPALETRHFCSLPGQLLFGTLRNVAARDERPGLDAVLAELARTEKIDALSDGRQDGARERIERYIALVPDDPELLAAFIDERATQVIFDRDIDDKAAADARPDEGETDADRFAEEFARALADVRKELGQDRSARRAPLFIDARKLLAKKFDGPRWLVTGLVTRGGLALIGGEPKTAKTWLATEIAIAIATGTRVCGEFTAQRGKAVYFYAEDLDVQVRNRVRALLKGGDRRLDEEGEPRLLLEPRGKFLDVLLDEDLAWIVASVRRIGSVDLLVLDPLRDVHSGEEDKSDSMRDVMRRLRALQTLLGCTVGAVHHAPKATKDNARRRPGQNLRGSSAIHGSVDSGIYMDEIKSDGTNVFANGIVSQVKGARSAGAFQVDLTLIDDDQGEALQATWKVTGAREIAVSKSSAITKADEAYEQDEAMVAFVTMLAKRGEAHTRRKLRTHAERPAKVPAGKLPGIVDRCCNRGRLYLEAGVVMVPGVQVVVQHHLEIDQVVQTPEPPHGADSGSA